MLRDEGPFRHDTLWRTGLKIPVYSEYVFPDHLVTLVMVPTLLHLRFGEMVNLLPFELLGKGPVSVP